MAQVLIEPHYLGSISYYALISKFDQVLLEINDTFPKQTYRNRCYFLTSNKVQPLIVPVKYSNGDKVKDVRIDNSQRWVKDHWGAFYSAYGKAPFYEYFYGDFQKIWQYGFKFLVDFNIAFINLTFKLLQLKKEVLLTTSFNTYHPYDFRNAINPKEKIVSRSVSVSHSRYNQLFGSNFEQNLSIVDLLLNEGNNAFSVINNTEVDFKQPNL